MDISWKPRAGVTGGAVVLAKTSPERGEGSMVCTTKERSFSQLVQAAQYPEAESVETFGRGNLQTSYAFSVAAQFTSAALCEKYCDELGDLMNSEGILEIKTPGGGVRSLEGVWISISARTQGVAASISYQFLGGAFLAGPSTNQVLRT